MTINHIFGTLSLVEAIVLAAVAYALYRKKRAKLTRCQRLWGDVVKVEERQGGEGGPTKHPVIRYKAMNGEVVTFTSKYGSSSWKVKEGDRLEILVNPGDSADAEVVGFMAQWFLPVILGAASIIGVIVSPIAYFYF